MLGTILWLVVAAPAWCAAEIDNNVKAAFIIRFAEFIDWPDHNGRAHGPFTVCVLGDHLIEPILVRMTTDYVIKGRSVAVRRLEEVESAAICHIVFVPDTQSAQLPALSRAVHAKPVLVVANRPDLATAGAAINLFRSGSRLRFEIDPDALETAGLKASSRLLKLAVIRK